MIPTEIRVSSPPPRLVRRTGTSSAGILAAIDLAVPPFSGREGCFFDGETLAAGLGLVRKGRVHVASVSLEGHFAGISGQVLESDDETGREVSLLIRQQPDGEWRIDARSGMERAELPSAPLAGLLISAMLERGVLEVRESGENDLLPPSMRLFVRDVRAGILHWDDSELRAVLEELVLVEFENPTMDLLQKIRGMGMKQLAATYPVDEIVPEYRNCYAYTGVRRSTQELFWADFLSNRRREVEALGCEIQIDPSLNVEVLEIEEWYGELSGAANPDQPVDWFSFECGLVIGGERINIVPCLIKYLEDKPPGFNLTDFEKIPPESKIPILTKQGSGRYVAVPAKKLHTILGILTELFDQAPMTDDEKIKVHPVRAAQLAAYEGEEKLVSKAPEKLKELAGDFEKLKPRTDPEAPEDFQATLRPYQQDGFEWLQFLREQGVGGILADDMGLGKTIQTLCHLHYEKVSGRADLPTLILAPKSVVPSWEREAKKFAPSLKVLALQGPQRKKYYSVLGYSDLVITSYPVLLRDAEELLLQPFHYVVLDEAHTIKNSTARITKVAYRIDARHRLCLSGTPIENNLGELWSQFHFLMPGFLGSEEAFSRCFRIPIEKYRDESRRKRLSERVAPLMLRRTKTLVATDLPPKTEIVKKIELNSEQIEIYEAVRASVQEEVREEIERHGVESAQILVLEALMKLRQVCCHPQMMTLPSARQRGKRSAKFDFMMEWLPGMVKEGRRILIFSQFTRMLSIIEKELEQYGISYITLTGQSKDRGVLCETFQSGKVPVFLISLRAGGTGITLTKADTVIHYDPWWNPSLENQATDRAYRLGQQNPVFVYKLISEGTIEDKILMLQEKKRALFNGILEGAPQKLSFSEKELDNLLAPIG